MNYLKKIFRVFILPLFVFAISVFYAGECVSAQNSGINFSVSTNNIYYPGDQIILNLRTYENYSGNTAKRKAEFTIDILKIRDINTFFSRQKSKYNIDVLSRDSMNLLYLTDEVYSFKKTIRQSNDMNYFYASENYPLTVTSKGAYIVKVTSENKVAYCGFIVSNLGLVSKTGNNAMLAFLVDRKTGQPVNNAEVNFYSGMKKIGSGKTSYGIFYQSITEEVINTTDNKEEPLIIAKLNDEIAVSDPNLFFGLSENRYSVYVYTQQPVYRTNSEVNFKGIIRENLSSDNMPLRDKEVTVIIKDPKGAEVYKQMLRTNSNGSFDGSYFIEEEASLGNYTINVGLNEKSFSPAGFSVEQYKKPEFKVTVTTDKSQYFGKDNLKAEIIADYFFGSPVSNAEVEYNIYKVRYFRPWWMYSEYSWWYEDYYEDLDRDYSNADFIYSGKGILDNNGRLEIDYILNEEFSEQENIDYWYRPYYFNSDYKYIVQAKVTDNSRREISGTATALVTKGGFTLSAKTDKYFYRHGEKVSIEVFASDYSNKPVQTHFEADIYKTSPTKYNDNGRKDFYKNISGITLSDGKGIVSFELDDADADGAYSVEIKAKDERSNIITAGTYFYVSDKGMWWYDSQSGAVQIITDKESYRQGEVCKAIINITNPGATVLITTNTDNIIYYKTEKFSDNSFQAEIPIGKEYASNFEINVNYVSDGVFYNSSKQVIVIPEEKFLTVQIDPSKLIYKPGESGNLKVRVLDNAGNPVRNAEVSIGIIDESIYSIKEDKTKDIRKFFYGNKNYTASTAFNNVNASYGNSRLLTIFEIFGIKNTSEKDLATVKGRLLKKNGDPVANALIVVNSKYQAYITDEEGNFEFRLPEGNYNISAYYGKIENKDLIAISLSKSQIKFITIYNDKAMNLSEIEQSDRDGGIFDGTMNTPGMSEMRSDIRGEKKMEATKQFDSGNDNFKSAEVRSDFLDAIFWSPYSQTDGNGFAEVNVKYPDNLTSWRITSRVITEDTKVGQMTTNVITRKDLLVRMETPRFFQDGDIVTVSTIVHNYLKEQKEVKLKFKTNNVTLIENSADKKIIVDRDSEARVDWKIRVDNAAGEAVLYAEALTNEESDAVELKVPLQPKGLKTDINTIADFSDDNKTETRYITIPDNAGVNSALMRITIDASLASTILTSLDELAGYPYGCVEQTMSRFLPSIVVAKAFKELNAPLSEATQKELPGMIDKGLKRLYGFQHSDGGWGWWENDQTNPFMTAYVVYGLSIAVQSGYSINETKFNKGIESLKKQLSDSKIDATTRAFMLYSLAVTGKNDNGIISGNIEKILSYEMNSYTRSLIALTWKLIGENVKAAEELKKLESSVKYSGEGAAYWDGKEFHYSWQDDKVQTTAMVLKAIINIDENSVLKDKVVRWLMMQRQGMAWRNTQETAVIIYSMVDYLKNSNELSPDYSLKVSLNGNNIFEKIFTREDAFKKSSAIIPDNKFIKAGQNEITIEKRGSGKVYFSSYLTYFIENENQKPLENGFRVEREYYNLEKYNSYSDNNITYRKKYFDGNLKSGNEVLVKLRVFTKDNDNQFFMLEDPLPSGFEVIKDDWAYRIEDENSFSGYPYYYWRWWYADKEIRDNKIVFFATQIGKGEFEFSYLMQAQIPGEYNVNPAKGMLMYYPDISGSSENVKIKVTE